MSKRSTQEQRDKLIELYFGGMSKSAAAATMGYTCKAVTLELRRRGLKERPWLEVSRRLFVNDHYFDQIDSAEKAYWIGFLAADGCISDRSITLGLGLKDLIHVELFKSCLQSEHKIGFSKKIMGDKEFWQATITVISRQLVASCVNLGVVPRKSLILEPCTQISEKYMRDYWRGIVDGDGCLNYSNEKKWRINLVGTEPIVEGFKNFLAQNNIVSKAKITKRKNIYYVMFAGTRLSKKIATLLYKDATIALPRKMALAQQILDTETRPEKSASIQ